MESLDPKIEMGPAEPEPCKSIIADVALVRLRQGVDYCVRSIPIDPRAAAFNAEQLFLVTGEAVLEVLRKARLGGANPFEAGGVYRTPSVAGAVEELAKIQELFRMWFGQAALVVEAELRAVAHEAKGQAWRLRPSMEMDEEVLERGELLLWMVYT